MGGLRLAVLLEVPSAWGIERTPFGRIIWFEVQQRDIMAVSPATLDV
jgi:hypothetical protein